MTAESAPAPEEPWARVVDASALAAVLFDEPEGDAVARRLGRAALVTTALLRFEVANVCWKKLRRHPEERAALIEAHRLIDQMELYELEVRLPEVVLWPSAKGSRRTTLPTSGWHRSWTSSW